MANIEISVKDQLACLPTLVGDDNYPMWNKRMTAFLRYRDLYDTVNQAPRPNPTPAAKKLLSESANILLMNISDKLYNSIVTDDNDNNGYKIWQRIREMYAARTGLRLSRTLTSWHKLQYEGNLSDFIDRVEACLAAFDSIGHTQENSAICGIITAKLADERSNLVDPIITNDILMTDPVLLINKLRDIAYNEQSRRKPPSSDRNGIALASGSRQRPPPGCKNGRHNPEALHPVEKCWALHPEQRPIRKNRQAVSHNTISSTPVTRITPGPTQYEKPAFAGVTTAISSFTTQSALPPVLDSGASHHMFNDLAFFCKAEPVNIPISTGRNNTNLTAIRQGTAVVFQSSGRILHLPDSLYVPGITRNLISLGRLTDKSTSITKEGDHCTVTIDDTISFQCRLINGVLELAHSIGPVSQLATSLSSTTHSSPTNPFTTWHNRLGHAGINRISAVLPGIKLVNNGACDSCMKGKLSQIPFKSHFDATLHPLEVVHADLVGPISPSTNAGARYFLTIVDQHTGFISVTLLKNKSDSASAIREFKTFFEHQTGQHIKKLITDGGGEFCSKQLSATLKDMGIQHNISPPYTPQHNGFAERANKTIINMARCMMQQANLAKEWWGEAVRTAAATTNCLPSLGKSKCSPLEQMFRKVPNINLFRPFGCKTWVLKPPQLRTGKFDAISWDGVLLGYSNDYSCYRVVKLGSLSIVDTKHAYFDESVFPSLVAINPSLDVHPHAPLPDFSSQSVLPYEVDEPQLSNASPDNDSMSLDSSDEENGQPSSCCSQSSDDERLSPQEAAPSRQRLILRLGPHPTQVRSDINAANILHRTRRPQAQAFSVRSVEPGNHHQAVSCDEREQWIAAELKEIDNMKQHSVWLEIPRLPQHHTIPSTWAYKKKLGASNEVVEYKARICAQGFRQTHGLNFEAKYAPTGKPSSLRLLLSHAVNQDLLIHQLDVKSAFLTCNLEERVYMLPPPGYRSGENIVLELKKAIYGLKQASLAWYKRLSTFLASIGFTTSTADPCVFWRTHPSPLWIFSHVDDLIIIGKDPESFRVQMVKEFQIKYMGDATFLLGMKIDRMEHGFVLNQSQYVQRKLVEFNAQDLPPSSSPLDPKSHLRKASSQDINQLKTLQVNYRALIGSLNYLSILTRPDISFAVSKLSQYLENPGFTHYTAAMQVFRYLSGTASLGLLFSKNQETSIAGFVDADWANCPDSRRSHTGFMLTRHHHLLSWKSIKQATVSLSSTEAEYKALADVCKEITWLNNLATEILIGDNLPSTISVDNKGAIDLALSQVSQNSFRTKHMDLRLHFVRDLISQKKITLQYVKSQANLADFLTKPVGRSTIRRSITDFTSKAQVVSASPQTARSTPACRNKDSAVPEPVVPNPASAGDDFLRELEHIRQDHDDTAMVP